jgi:chaperonin GroES
MTVATPTRDNVLARKYESGGMTKGGIALPDIADVPNKAVVVAVGSGHLTQDGAVVPLEVEEGDTIFYHHGHATPVDVGGESLLVIRESAIFLVEK